MFRKLYYIIFKRYKRLEIKFVSYAEGDKMIRASVGKPEEEKWVLAKEEDTNKRYGFVYLERKVRIRS